MEVNVVQGPEIKELVFKIPWSEVRLEQVAEPKNLEFWKRADSGPKNLTSLEMLGLIRLVSGSHAMVATLWGGARTLPRPSGN